MGTRNLLGAAGLKGQAEGVVRTADEDVALMLAFRAGDTAAFAPLFRRWSGPLLRYADRMVRDLATAEEFVQETLIRVHRAREHDSPDARFSTWLYRIATNLALRENFARLRSFEATERARIPDNVERFRELPPERRRKIRRAWEQLRELTPEERQALWDELLAAKTDTP